MTLRFYEHPCYTNPATVMTLNLHSNNYWRTPSLTAPLLATLWWGELVSKQGGVCVLWTQWALTRNSAVQQVAGKKSVCTCHWQTRGQYNWLVWDSRAPVVPFILPAPHLRWFPCQLPAIFSVAQEIWLAKYGTKNVTKCYLHTWLKFRLCLIYKS